MLKVDVFQDKGPQYIFVKSDNCTRTTPALKKKPEKTKCAYVTWRLCCWLILLSPCASFRLSFYQSISSKQLFEPIELVTHPAARSACALTSHLTRVVSIFRHDALILSRDAFIFFNQIFNQRFALETVVSRAGRTFDSFRVLPAVCGQLQQPKRSHRCRVSTTRDQSTLPLLPYTVFTGLYVIYFLTFAPA